MSYTFKHNVTYPKYTGGGHTDLNIMTEQGTKVIETYIFFNNLNFTNSPIR